MWLFKKKPVKQGQTIIINHDLNWSHGEEDDCSLFVQGVIKSMKDTPELWYYNPSGYYSYHGILIDTDTYEPAFDRDLYTKKEISSIGIAAKRYLKGYQNKLEQERINAIKAPFEAIAQNTNL